MSPTNPRRESSHEPLSPPRSPVYDDEMPTRRHATVEDEDDEDDHVSSSRSSAPSSPPTSVDAPIKPETFTNPPSGRTSLSSVNARNNNGNDDGGQFRLPSLTLSQFSDMRSEGEEEGEDDFSYQRQHESPLEDPESQWESEGPAPPKQHRRKSATPTSAKTYPRSARPSTSSGKFHLQPQQSSSRRATHFYSSRASSASYNETVQGDRKAPLVLLHITLLFLPGAEEAILRKITPTILERGLLVEHPRGDYQLLEELIIDSLGLDDALVPGQDDEEHEQDEWEKSLGVRRVKAKSKWEIRVYAANGLMTAGAWKRVWGEMERVDVEVGPKGWRGKKTDELIRGFVRSGGRNGIKDGASGKGKRSSFSTFDAPPAVDVKWWMGVVGIAVLMLAGSFGLFWTLRRQWRVDGIQNQVVYSAGGNDVGMIQVNESVAVDGVLLPEALVGLTMNATDPVASTVESEEHQSNSNEETPTSATPLNSETTDACGRTTQVAGAEEDGASNSVDELKNSDIPPMDQSSSTVRGCETLNDPIPTANSAEATEEVVAPVLLSFDEAEESAGSDPLGWWNNWKAGLRV